MSEKGGKHTVTCCHVISIIVLASAVAWGQSGSPADRRLQLGPRTASWGWSWHQNYWACLGVSCWSIGFYTVKIMTQWASCPLFRVIHLQYEFSLVFTYVILSHLFNFPTLFSLGLNCKCSSPEGFLWDINEIVYANLLKYVAWGGSS